jgi:3-deoxy-D-manno-octulosonate 8-phosphate phosphatase KdsC-like HAD superfamily phosphatase
VLSLPWTENKIQRYIKEGRGQGCGSAYKSWYGSADIDDTTTFLHMGGSWINNRTHFIVNELGMLYFFATMWDENILDVRENYPLDLTVTLSISSRLKIVHERCKKNKIPIVMTSSFLLTELKDGIVTLHAVDILYAANASVYKRTVNLFRVKKEYWEEQGIKHSIITPNDLNLVLSRNLELLHIHKEPNRYQVKTEICDHLLDQLHLYKENILSIKENRVGANMDDFVDYVLKSTQYDTTVYALCKKVSADLGISYGEISNHFLHLIANRIVQFNIEQESLNFAKLKIDKLIIKTTP